MKYFFSLTLYRLFLLLFLPILLLVLLIRSINHKAYRQRLLERLGLLASDLKPGGIVVHAASVGEVIALKSFINKLIEAYPSLPITVTTFTPTGSAQVKQLFGSSVQHCYFPLDVICCSWLFIRKLQPKAVVFMETELWPNIIAQCKSKQIKLQLINARLSQNSVKSYQKLRWLIQPTLNAFDAILAQSKINQDNFITLGATQEQCLLSGNLKFDIAINQQVMNKKEALKAFISGERKIWVVASTHPDDEALVLAAFAQLIIENPRLLLVIVPRHPERFEQVAELCKEQHFSVIQRSHKVQVTPSTQIWLLDTLGELLPVCALADVVTMGGSFSHIGGHNPLEPALFKKPIVVGPDMANFSEVMQQLQQANGICQISAGQNISEQLATTMNQLLNDNQAQQALGENAYSVVQNNQGASDKTLKNLQALLTT